MTKVRMRYPKQALAELRKEDPDTGVTLHMIRALAKQGKVPSVKGGRGYLINYDALVAYLAAPEQACDAFAGCGGIRPVDERLRA